MPDFASATLTTRWPPSEKACLWVGSIAKSAPSPSSTRLWSLRESRRTVSTPSPPDWEGTRVCSPSRTRKVCDAGS
jgi:hypothetical protein